ncbi:MAG: hypothetical protein IPN91_15880 [Holophagaceae bacterium]|uniref:4Fe-4S ferredoxin-type domain-containing protein n=1 Tax=Candidatus Geothrix odensensis TaxID=2954440 RepID=A0A936F4Q6_9BACT|nr:hypothetical protein [Candidatus Geothrix odensensis]
MYANTLPVPKDPSSRLPPWAHLASWKAELAAPYQQVLRMLGPPGSRPDPPRRNAEGRRPEIGRGSTFEHTNVAVYFGKSGETVRIPSSTARSERTGCTLCGGCMLGCNHGAKNTLDRNTLPGRKSSD